VTAYAALLAIHNRARCDRYAAAFMPVLDKHGGRLVAADERPEVIEGEWRGDKMVVLAFPDRGAFTPWPTSPEYRRIAEDRVAAADTVVLLVRGLA
jgi:uncharacterized protein (DUF1330 family)